MQEAAFRRNVAANVRRLRENMQVSQEALAELCGLYRSHVGKVEREEIDPTLGTLVRLATGLGVHPSVLLRTPPRASKPRPLPRGPRPGNRSKARGRRRS